MNNTVKLPGLIDIHVHFRDPGQTEKEDFLTGSRAALAGGFTTVIDMPNNKIPITTEELLQQKTKLATQNTVCDIGFHFGSLGDNLGQLDLIKGKVFGIKLYLNQTTGNFIIDKDKLTKIYANWSDQQPILLHCEDETMQMALNVIRQTKKKTHFCHVSSKAELEAIISAKNEGLPISCGVTPHHLFLTSTDAYKLGTLGKMKPFLKTQQDIDFLWQNLSKIDLIESDHAPHTLAEKQGDNPPFGVPGLETTLPLLLTAVSEKKLKMDDIIRLCHTSPAKIFNIPTDKNTYIEVDENLPFTLGALPLFTKCGWSPFEGKRVRGKVKSVYIRGEKVFEDDRILAKPGSGKVIQPLR